MKQVPLRRVEGPCNTCELYNPNLLAQCDAWPNALITTIPMMYCPRWMPRQESNLPQALAVKEAATVWRNIHRHFPATYQRAAMLRVLERWIHSELDFADCRVELPPITDPPAVATTAPAPSTGQAAPRCDTCRHQRFRDAVGRAGPYCARSGRGDAQNLVTCEKESWFEAK